MAEEFTFFWNGPFSQWSTSPFKFEGMKFNCAEQFMMFMKAVFFKDYESAKKIMKTEHPGNQKQLGRKVSGFNVDKWANVARDLVYVGNYCKFTQSRNHKGALDNTEGTTLVEASPYDKIWGIGLSEGDPLSYRRATWQGKNWLGETITKVREDIRAHRKYAPAYDLARKLVKEYKNHG